MQDILLSVKTYLLSVYGLIGALLLGAMFGAFFLYRIGRFWAEYRGRKYRLRGKKAEKRAAKMLKKAGYTILEREPRIQTTLKVQGEVIQFDITPDFLVTDGEEKMTVEVKSQGDCQLIHQAGVRRQVAEYIYATKCPCLLVTTEDSGITRIEFTD